MSAVTLLTGSHICLDAKLRTSLGVPYGGVNTGAWPAYGWVGWALGPGPGGPSGGLRDQNLHGLSRKPQLWTEIRALRGAEVQQGLRTSLKSAEPADAI